MSITIQNILVGIIIAVAFFFFIKRFVLKIGDKDKGCSCGQGNCNCKNCDCKK
ncbi:MAG: FeoB-associated Cys-rich membrane protein [Bacteroidales bacterium]|nr:FeoB-associated Cys-rich membrane protein [Bacteroidales bacterium]